MSVPTAALTREDAEWAKTFVTLYKFLDNHPNSEKATLLLSTCRNAYLTANALFADIQELLGGASMSPLRSGCELVAQGSTDIEKLKKRFQESLGTVAQFDQKFVVWRTRQALMDSIRAQHHVFKEQHPIDAILIDDIISGADVGPADQPDGRSAELLKIDLSERSHLEPQFEALRKLRDILDAAARLGLSYSDGLVSPPAPQMTLIEEEEVTPKVPAEERTSVFCAGRLARICGWTATDQDSALQVRIEPTYARPHNAQALTPILISQDHQSVASAAVATLLREALYSAHAIALAKFKPNVSVPPMPAVFEIALPVPRPTLSGSAIQSLRLDRVLCSSAHRPPNHGKIALANLAVPVGRLNTTDYAFTDMAVSELIEADFNKAVHSAAEQGCLAIAFPEYSIPRAMHERLLDIANRNKLVVIGGFEGQWQTDKLCDEVFVAIPGEPRLYHQYKQSPSLEEPQPATFHHDGVLRLFCNSPIGDFAIIVCSDYLEAATFDAWTLDGPLPDVLFVIARNQYADLYKNFAIADSFRLYCCVAVCNVLDSDAGATSEGTFVVTPEKAAPVQLGSTVIVAGTFLSGISVHEISFEAIRARERGKPAKNFFAVPRSAQRT